MPDPLNGMLRPIVVLAKHSEEFLNERASIEGLSDVAFRKTEVRGRRLLEKKPRAASTRRDRWTGRVALDLDNELTRRIRLPRMLHHAPVSQRTTGQKSRSLPAIRP